MTANSWIDQSVRLVRKANYVIRSRQNSSSFLPNSAQELDLMLDRASDEHVLKNDRTTTVVRISECSPQVVLKRYNPRNRWHKVKRAFRRSRARNCWDMSFIFQRAGLNVSPPIMMFEKRAGLIRKDAYFANECLDGDELLKVLPFMSSDEQASVQREIYSAFEKLALARITHGDMKASNLLWVNNSLFFIDLDAAQQHSRWSFSWRRKRVKDKKRFLKNWQDQPDLLALFSGLQ